MEVDWDIDSKLKPFIKIVIVTPVSDYLVQLFCQATRIISKVAKPQLLKVIFYRQQFRIITSDENVAVYIKNMILYDIDEIEAITDKRMILAVLLEELVHALLEIHDEVETSIKVSELYSDIKADPITGQYILPNKS